MEGISDDLFDPFPDSVLIIMLVLIGFTQQEYEWNTYEIQVELYL